METTVETFENGVENESGVDLRGLLRKLNANAKDLLDGLDSLELDMDRYELVQAERAALRAKRASAASRERAAQYNEFNKEMVGEGMECTSYPELEKRGSECPF